MDIAPMWLGKKVLNAIKEILLAIINKLNIFYIILLLFVLGYFGQDYLLQLIKVLTLAAP